MRALVACACAIAALPAAAGAQTFPPDRAAGIPTPPAARGGGVREGDPGLSLTESQALARLSSESPRVQAVRAAVDVARADALAAGRWPNPRVTYNREAVAGITENMLMVAQSLPIAGRRRLEIDAASARIEASASRADDQLRRLRADLRLAFTSLWLAQTRERELARSRDRLRDLSAVLGRREAAGEAAGFDRLRADREVIDIEADRGAAASERVRAQGALVSFFADVPGTVVVAVADDRPSPTALPPLDELLASARRRGVLVGLQHDARAAELVERAAARRVIPEPELVAGTKTSNAGAGDVGSIVSVHVGIPLFDRARPERAAARARAAQARAEADAVSLAVRAQVAAWRAAVIERREIADQYREAVTASVNQIERIAEVSYEAGERGILELLDAYRSASSARVRQAALDAAVREAEIELEFVSGWEIP